MKVLILDVETTINNKGNPFDETNRLCLVGLSSSIDNVARTFDIEFSDSPNGDSLRDIQTLIDEHDLLVGFNIKFDLHWLRRYGLTFTSKRIWDCQLAHFILSGQSNPYPSLDGVAQYHGLGSKLDTVAEYWKQGIDTDAIPIEVLIEYLEKDLEVTRNVYIKQAELLSTTASGLKTLVSLHNQDILVLEEMEYNGLLFDEDKCLSLSKELEVQIEEIDTKLFGNHMVDGFNPNSNDHLSALLYGGTISIPRREVIGTFKTGARAGQPKERWVDKEYVLSGFVKPIEGSELKKEGLFSTDEPTLRQLKCKGVAKDIVETLLKRAELDKRRGTYYDGLPKLRRTMNWEQGKLHGQLNQCVVVTGRLSSSRPNLQNFDGEIKTLFRSQYV
jgi:DNA polymerase-1